MNTSILVGAIIKFLSWVVMGIYFLYLHFKPESETVKSMQRLPLIRVIFKYKYSFLVSSILIFVKAIFDILNLLGRL